MTRFFTSISSEKLDFLKRLIGFIVWSIILGVVGWLVWKDRVVLLNYIQKADYSRFLWGIFFYVCSLASALIGWFLLMSSFKPILSFRENTIIYLITLVSRRLPGRFWYVGGRMAIYQERGIPKTAVLVASSLEFLYSGLTGLLISSVILLMVKQAIFSVQSIIILLMAVIIGLFILQPSVINFIMNRVLKRSMQMTLPKYWWSVGPFFIMNWVFGGFMVTQYVRAFTPLSSVNTWFVIGGWILACSVNYIIFFLPTNLGITEIALATFLTQIMPLPLAGTLAILVRVLTTLFEITVSILATILYRTLNRSI